MLQLLYLCIVISKRVNIVYSEDSTLKLAVLRKGKGATVRIMKEEDIPDYSDQDSFHINGEETLIENSGEFVCGKSSGMGVVMCESEDSKRSMFKIIKKGDNVKLQTDKNLCLTKAGFDKKTNGHYVHLKKCKNDKNQEFDIVDVSSPSFEPTTKDTSKEITPTSLEIDFNLPAATAYSPSMSRYLRRHSTNVTEKLSPSEYHEFDFEIPSKLRESSQPSKNFSSSVYRKSLLSDSYPQSSYQKLKTSYKYLPSAYFDLIGADNMDKSFSRSNGYRKRTITTSTSY
ncbi:hypothetical protein NGRA_0591 [Nosema granulosis]|uniref:Uncharacterized protein n=1 Tax=Nosema granulosis TaxID=83296 RepID=A0A9P6H035_9MICR|nr:hypothetical protein NGRA_0591 [Nosema granulosis]